MAWPTFNGFERVTDRNAVRIHRMEKLAKKSDLGLHAALRTIGDCKSRARTSSLIDGVDAAVGEAMCPLEMYGEE